MVQCWGGRRVPSTRAHVAPCVFAGRRGHRSCGAKVTFFSSPRRPRQRSGPERSRPARSTKTVTRPERAVADPHPCAGAAKLSAALPGAPRGTSTQLQYVRGRRRADPPLGQHHRQRTQQFGSTPQGNRAPIVGQHTKQQCTPSALMNCKNEKERRRRTASRRPPVKTGNRRSGTAS